MGWWQSASLAAAGDPPPPPPRRHVCASQSSRPTLSSSSITVRSPMVGYRTTTTMNALFILLLSLSTVLTVLKMPMTAEAQSIAAPLPVTPVMPTNDVYINFTEALRLSTLFLDAQRSGEITDDRVPWRGNSTLNDGADVGEDFSGGYFDSGDTTKTTFPMAFGITMMSWAVIDYRNYFAEARELQNVLRAIRWGTDYLLKVWKPDSKQLYVIVGDKLNDDKCWMRPENLNTTRLSYQVNATAPGTDVAGELTAAFAAAALAWNMHDNVYATKLINASMTAFLFATGEPKDMYSVSVPVENSYPSFSNYGDELLWGATWLYKASNTPFFKNYTLQLAQFYGGYTDRGEFSWDDKFAAVQVLMGREAMRTPALNADGLMLNKYKQLADNFMCVYLDKTKRVTAGGLVHLSDQGPTQYAISSAFLAVVYADYIMETGGQGITCGASGNSYSPAHLMNYAYSQARYILGANPYGYSYMVGFGSNFPRRVHHRGASFPDYRTDPIAEYSCNLTRALLTSVSNNPNNLTGAVVGGPNLNDMYEDVRTNTNQSQVQFATGAMWTALLGRLTAPAPPANLPPVVVASTSPTTVSPSTVSPSTVSPTSVSPSIPGPMPTEGNPNCPDPVGKGYPGVNYTIETVFQYTQYGESVAQYRCVIWNNNNCPIRNLTINCQKFIATEYWMVRVIGKDLCMLKDDKPVLAIMERYEFGYVQTTALKPVFSTNSYIVEPA